jgi:hypothetical protein
MNLLKQLAAVTAVEIIFETKKKKPIKRFPGCCYERETSRKTTGLQPRNWELIQSQTEDVRLGIFWSSSIRKPNKFQNQEGPEGLLRSLQLIYTTSGEE